jgi:hypothetical protein
VKELKQVLVKEGAPAAFGDFLTKPQIIITEIATNNLSQKGNQ